MLWGGIQIGNLRGQVVDLSQEVLESRRYVNAGSKRGAEQREEHLFSDREGGDVRRGNGGETGGGEH